MATRCAPCSATAAIKNPPAYGGAQTGGQLGKDVGGRHILHQRAHYANACGRTFRKVIAVSHLFLPADASARLHTMSGTDVPFVVAVAFPPVKPIPEAIFSRRGAVSALFTHDAGVSWPDPEGEALASALLVRRCGFVLAFATQADALACHRRLTGGRA